jgi:adenylate cyclase, class 2
LSIEVELKAWLTSYEATRKAVEAAGATFVKETEKRDNYYGPERKRALDIDFAKDPIFRIRSEEGKAVVAVKRREIDDGVEINDELEFEIADQASFREFARLIGFAPFIVKRKKSRRYSLGRATIELQKVDPLGDFIEIEILVEDREDIPEAQAEIRALLERFGVPKEKIEPRQYIDLLRRIGRGMPGRGE